MTEKEFLDVFPQLKVDPELETLIREQFFADTPADTMDSQEVTTQIR